MYCTGSNDNALQRPHGVSGVMTSNAVRDYTTSIFQNAAGDSLFKINCCPKLLRHDIRTQLV